MAKYIGPLIVGTSVALVLGLVISPFFSVIIGGFIAGVMCKGGVSGGAVVGFLSGIITAIPFMLLAGLVTAFVPFVWVPLGRVSIGTMLIVGVLGLVGGVIGGLIRKKA
jgi:hypothetical protein